jgi:UDP:flavonoid glycosyltransferase YjiC (YdhE family)
MRVLAACSLGGSGHLQPLLPLLDAARRNGHDALVVGPPALTDMVAATGFPFVGGGEPPESVIAPIRERLPIVEPQEAAVLANREIFAALATDAMVPAMRELVTSWQPELILRDPCEYASAIVAHESSVPVAQVAIGLAAVEWSSIAIAAPALEARLRGLPAMLRGSRYVSRFPASLDPSQFSDTRRYDHDTAAAAAPLPEWWEDSDLPLVYVSFGTVLGHMTIAEAVYRTALEAVGELEARVLVTVGRRFDPESLGMTPPNVHVTTWVDQDEVVREAAAVVCHGGSGTTFGALRAGVPVVVVPLFADQGANAAKIAESSSGIVVDLHHRRDRGRAPLDLEDAPAIAAAIRSLLTDHSYRQHAHRIAEEMAGAPSADQLLRELLTDATSSPAAPRSPATRGDGVP